MKVVEARGWLQLHRFLALAEEIYRDHPRWVSPLRLHQGAMLAGNPAWTVVEGGRTVARMAARVHRQAGREAIHFGFFECREGHPEAARLLVERARALAPGLPLRGPYHFRQEDPYPGLLVDGFDVDPTFLMPYNPPWYDGYLKEAGLRPVMDLYAHEVRPETARLDLLESRVARARAQGIEVRTMDRRHRAREVRSMCRLFNRFLADNWGFEEFEEAQIREMTVLAYAFLEPHMVFLASHEGRDVGCAIVVRDFNPLLKPARGRITPALVWDYLFHRKRLQRFRGYALGVLPECRHMDVPAALVGAILEGARASEPGWESMEVAWVLADNARMNAMANAFGARRTKTYRLFEALPA